MYTVFSLDLEPILLVHILLDGCASAINDFLRFLKVKTS